MSPQLTCRMSCSYHGRAACRQQQGPPLQAFAVPGLMDEMQWGRSRLRDDEGRGVVQWWGGTLEPRTFLVATAYTWQSMKQVGLYRACSPQLSCRQA
jgi:hypothetical protein